MHICTYMYIYNIKCEGKELKENQRHIFFYKYFDVFTKSSAVYNDQIIYKKIYSQQ